MDAKKKNDLFSAKELLLKEIDLVQACILRMANNSFFIKGWAITLATASLVLSLKEKLYALPLAIVFSLIMFWWLDAFFLNLERKYRMLYSKKIELRLENKLDSPFSLDASTFKVRHAFFSKTLIGFYGILIALFSIVTWGLF